MSNSQSAHDVSACDIDDGFGETGVYARRTGTVQHVAISIQTDHLYVCHCVVHADSTHLCFVGV